MTLTIDAARLEDRLREIEDAIAADGFVVLRFEDTPTPEPTAVGFSNLDVPGIASHARGRHPVMPARAHRSGDAVASSPQRPPSAPVRAPYIRSERNYRRRGAWLEWQRPAPLRRWLVRAVWAWLAVHVAAWCLR